MPVFQVILIVIMAVIMFGMGCAVELEKLRHHFKRPIVLCFGLMCQILLMPLLTFALIALFPMSTVQGIAFMLVGCSPGGSNSNLLTYLVNGDISLSVAMTTVSNLLSLGTLPFWTFVYLNISKIEKDITIPYGVLFGTLLSVVTPIAIGIAIRYKFPEKVRKVPKVCGIAGFISLVASLIVMVIVTDMPFEFSTEVFLPVAALPIAGITLSYILSFIPRLEITDDARKAIPIEVAVQNAGVTNSVLVISFGNQITHLGQALSISLLYIIFNKVLTTSIVVLYRLYLCCTKYLSRRQHCISDESEALHSGNKEDGKLPDAELFGKMPKV